MGVLRKALTRFILDGLCQIVVAPWSVRGADGTAPPAKDLSRRTVRRTIGVIRERHRHGGRFGNG
jgi:hypothetical protein